MKFSELSRMIAEAEEKKGIERICPYCKYDKWGVDYAHKYIASFGVGGRSHKFIPCLIMVCEKCGNTLILNPDVLGLDMAKYMTEEVTPDEQQSEV